MPKVVSSISKNKRKGKNGASSDFFGQETAEGSMIQPQSSTSHSMAAGTSSQPVANITLRCVFDGESSSNSFEVSLPLTADVSDLKDAIKDKNSPEFDFIAAFRFTLWKVLIPLPQDYNDDDIEEEGVEEEGSSRVCLDEIPKKEKKLLQRVSKKVSIVFGSHPDDNTIHVVVKRPPTARKRDYESRTWPRYCGNSLNQYSKKDCTIYQALAEIEARFKDRDLIVVIGNQELNKQLVNLAKELSPKIYQANTVATTFIESRFSRR
ncbi:hypothetical protein BGX27_000217 [Mortierella sp. AM989]|nr:hypothetical protein BGX27_000217 [Mortierella sp. AM989]